MQDICELWTRDVKLVGAIAMKKVKIKLTKLAFVSAIFYALAKTIDVIFSEAKITSDEERYDIHQ